MADLTSCLYLFFLASFILLIFLYIPLKLIDFNTKANLERAKRERDFEIFLQNNNAMSKRILIPISQLSEDESFFYDSTRVRIDGLWCKKMAKVADLPLHEQRVWFNNWGDTFKLVITHIWVKNFGWEKRDIYTEEDFDKMHLTASQNRRDCGEDEVTFKAYFKESAGSCVLKCKWKRACRCGKVFENECNCEDVQLWL